VIKNKSWALLPKLDDIIPSSTATGAFVYAPSSSTSSANDVPPESEPASDEDDEDNSSLGFDPRFSLASSLNASIMLPPAAAQVPTSTAVTNMAPFLGTSTPTMATSGPSATTTHVITSAPLTTHTGLTTPASMSSGGSKGKRKRSALQDLDGTNPLSTKRHTASQASSRHPSHPVAPSKPASSQQSSSRRDDRESIAGAAVLSNVQGTLNRISDAIVKSVEATTQGVIQAAVEKINGAQGTEDKLTQAERLYLIRLLADQPNKASAYVAQHDPNLRRAWIRMELLQFRDQIEKHQVEESMDVVSDSVNN